MLETGTQIQILRTQSVDGIIWAYISADTLTENGWVVAVYLNTVEGEALPTVSAAATPTSPSPASDVTVTTKGAVDLYASPTVKSRVVFRLEDGSPVTILRIDSIGELSWAYVQSVDPDRPGWIPLDSLDTDNVDLSIYTTPVTYPTMPLPMQSDGINITGETSATAKEALTLYVSPSLNARIKGELAQGESVTVIRIDSIGQTTWAFIRSDTQDSPGWTLADALDLGNGVSIPSADDMELLEAIAEKQTAAREEHMQSDAFRRQLAQLMRGTATYTYDTAKNVYSEPSLNSSVMAEVEAGTVLHQSEVQFNDEGAWVYITADTLPEGGWILAALAEDANMPQAMVEGTPAVVTGPLNVRSEPDLKSSVVAMLETGTQVEILRSETKDETTWAYISFDGANATGWVAAEYLNTSENSTPATVSVPLNVRSAPSVSSSAIAMLETGTQVRILYSENMNGTIWARISCDEPSVIGWVVADYLNTSENEIVPTDSGSTQFPDDEAEYNAVVKSLLAFANPSQVQVLSTLGWEPAADRQPLSFEDAVCSTDTWHFVDSAVDSPVKCMIVLNTKDGSTARIWDVDGSIHIAHPDGTTEVCMSGFQGDELLNMVYDWAKAKG